MKKILLLSLIAFCLSLAHSQTTIVLKDGSHYSGTIVDSTKKRISVILIGRKEPVEILRNEISFMLNSDSVAEKDRKDAITFTHYKTLPSTYFKRAGNFGAVSITGIIGGGIVGIVGAVMKNTTVAYVGAGVSGAGVIFLIPTFLNLHKGGQALQDKGW